MRKEKVIWVKRYAVYNIRNDVISLISKRKRDCVEYLKGCGGENEERKIIELTSKIKK